MARIADDKNMMTTYYGNTAGVLPFDYYKLLETISRSRERQRRLKDRMGPCNNNNRKFFPLQFRSNFFFAPNALILY